MLKKILIILLVGSLFGCGYQPLYLKKDNKDYKDYPIEIWELKGNKKINKSIISFLDLERKKKTGNGYKLILDSKRKLEIISKDKKGNPSSLRLTLVVNLLLNSDEKLIKEKQFSKSFSYNNSQNKFELSQYEKNIEKNLINEIAQKIYIFLRS